MRPSADLNELLANYKSYNDEEALNVKQLQNFLEHGENHYCRSNLVAHVVADAWVLNEDKTKVALVEHSANNFWLAPGGHCDGDSDVYSGALREAEEETGLNNLLPLSCEIFDVNVGVVPVREKAYGVEPRHIQFDVCFAFTSKEVPLKISDESTDLAWVKVEDIKNMKFWPEHMRRVEKSLKLLAESKNVA